MFMLWQKLQKSPAHIKVKETQNAQKMLYCFFSSSSSFILHFILVICRLLFKANFVSMFTLCASALSDGSIYIQQ